MAKVFRQMPACGSKALCKSRLGFGRVQVGLLAFCCPAGFQVWKSHRDVKRYGGMSRRCCTATETATGLRGLPPRLTDPSLPQTALHASSILFSAFLLSAFASLRHLITVRDQSDLLFSLRVTFTCPSKQHACPLLPPVVCLAHA
jgi:hypothetical protein